MRRVIAALIVVVLAVGVVLLWPRPTTDDTPTTLAGPTTTRSTSTSTPPTSTTTTSVTSTTTTADNRVVETVEEAETILRDFLFHWFLAIYQQDEEMLRSIVGNPRQIEAAVDQFGVMEFTQEPTREAIVVNSPELLRADRDCLVIWSESGAEFRGGVSAAVHVFRWSDGSWLFINTWLHRNDLWEADCEALIQQ